MHPRQSIPLHPERRIRFRAGIHVEREPDREQDASLDLRFISEDPILLLRRAEPNPNEIRREAIDFLQDLRLVFWFEITVARADDFEVRIFLQKKLLQAADAFVVASQKIMRERRRAPEHAFAHEGGTVNAITQLRALAIQAPDERHAMRNEIIHGACDPAEFRVTAAKHHDVSVGEIDG